MHPFSSSGTMVPIEDNVPAIGGSTFERAIVYGDADAGSVWTDSGPQPTLSSLHACSVRCCRLFDVR